MRLSRWLVLVVAVLAVERLPMLADGTGGTGSTDETKGIDNAMARIQAATTLHIDVLTALLAKVPAQAQPGIERAIAAAQKGHDTALAALAAHDAKEPDE